MKTSIFAILSFSLPYSLVFLSFPLKNIRSKTKAPLKQKETGLDQRDGQAPGRTVAWAIQTMASAKLAAAWQAIQPLEPKTKNPNMENVGESTF